MAIVDDLSLLRVLVVGDHKVGKSSLIHRLEYGGPPSVAPRPTVGSSISVLESFGMGENFLVDIREIGGHGAFKSARSVFYSKTTAFDAIIIVLSALDKDRPEKRWVRELENNREWEDSLPKFGGNPDQHCSNFEKYDEESPSFPERSTELSNPLGAHSSASVQWTQRPEGCIPTLFVANKADLLDIGGGVSSDDFQPAKRTHGDAVLVSALDPHLDTHSFHDFFQFALLQKQSRHLQGLPTKDSGLVGCQGAGVSGSAGGLGGREENEEEEGPRPHDRNVHLNDSTQVEPSNRGGFEYSDDDEKGSKFLASPYSQEAFGIATAVHSQGSSSTSSLARHSPSLDSHATSTARQRAVSREYRHGIGRSSSGGTAHGAFSSSTSGGSGGDGVGSTAPLHEAPSSKVSQKPTIAGVASSGGSPEQRSWSPTAHIKVKDKGKLM